MSPKLAGTEPGREARVLTSPIALQYVLTCRSVRVVRPIRTFTGCVAHLGRPTGSEPNAQSQSYRTYRSQAFTYRARKCRPDGGTLNVEEARVSAFQVLVARLWTGAAARLPALFSHAPTPRFAQCVGLLGMLFASVARTSGAQTSGPPGVEIAVLASDRLQFDRVVGVADLVTSGTTAYAYVVLSGKETPLSFHLDYEIQCGPETSLVPDRLIRTGSLSTEAGGVVVGFWRIESVSGPVNARILLRPPSGVVSPVWDTGGDGAFYVESVRGASINQNPTVATQLPFWQVGRRETAPLRGVTEWIGEARPALLPADVLFYDSVSQSSRRSHVEPDGTVSQVDDIGTLGSPGPTTSYAHYFVDASRRLLARRNGVSNTVVTGVSEVIQTSRDTFVVARNTNPGALILLSELVETNLAPVYATGTPDGIWLAGTRIGAPLRGWRDLAVSLYAQSGQLRWTMELAQNVQPVGFLADESGAVSLSQAKDGRYSLTSVDPSGVRTFNNELTTLQPGTTLIGVSPTHIWLGCNERIDVLDRHTGQEAATRQIPWPVVGRERARFLSVLPHGDHWLALAVFQRYGARPFDAPRQYAVFELDTEGNFVREFCAWPGADKDTLEDTAIAVPILSSEGDYLRVDTPAFGSALFWLGDQ